MTRTYSENLSHQKPAETANKSLEQHNRELALLNRVGRELSAMLDPQAVTQHLLQAVTETLNAEGAALWLWDTLEASKERHLLCLGFCNMTQNCMMQIDLHLKPEQGITGWVAVHGQSIILKNAPNDPRFDNGIDQLTGLHTHTLLATPLWSNEEILGVLEILNKQQGDFTANVTLVETLAASAAIALQNAILVQELQQRTEELQSRNDDLDAFAHTVAHDLQNPLGRIVGFAEVLEQQLETFTQEELHRYLNLIARNGRKMGDIIEALLLLASLEPTQVQLSPLDMDQIFNEAQTRLSDLIQEQQAILSLPKSWPAALGYAPWIEEVWVNYLSNALKYGRKPETGQPPNITIGTGTTKVEETTQGLHTQRFWIKDNGPGLTTTEQARLFKPFERLHQPHAKGHGLGLSIVARIIHKLGGEVGVESQLGEGSCFWFTLPIL